MAKAQRQTRKLAASKSPKVSKMASGGIKAAGSKFAKRQLMIPVSIGKPANEGHKV